jgi:hypothetical protein
VTCPCLFVHGELDEVIPSRHSEMLYQSCKSAIKKLRMCPKAGHTHFEEPCDTVDPIASFLLEYFKPNNIAQIIQVIVYVYIYICIFTCICIHINIYVYISIFTYMYVFMCVCIYVYMYISIYIYVYIYVCAYMYVHIYLYSYIMLYRWSNR